MNYSLPAVHNSGEFSAAEAELCDRLIASGVSIVEAFRRVDAMRQQRAS